MDQLGNLIKKKLHRGYPEGELREDLKEQGYTQDEIDRAFLFASRKNLPARTSEFPLWYAVSVGVLIFGISLKAVKGLWLEPIAVPLIVIGIVGILLRLLLPGK